MFKIKLFSKISTFLSLLLISSFYIVSRIQATDYTETFDNLVSYPELWLSRRDTVTFATDGLRTYAVLDKSGSSNYFNYYRTVNLFTLKPDFSSIVVGMKFSSNSILQGAGYIYSDNVPLQGDSLHFDDYMFYIWPKPDGTFHLFSSICPYLDPSCDVSFQLSNGVYAMPVDTKWHELSVKRIDSHYEWYIDENIFFKTVDTSRIISSLGIGDPEDTTGSQTWPYLNVDYVGLDYTASKSFPYLAQANSSWGNKEYDTAQSWAGVTKSGIDRWGCALTSVAMVLQNYNVKMPTGEVVNPDNLNTWLKSQPDGYIGPGLLNWLAVTRFAKTSFDAGQAPKKLEYERTYLPTTPILPAILGTGSHFVVAHGEDTTNWNINDPANVNNKTLSKTSSLKSINRFVQSDTDLSYMLFVLNPGDSAALKDGNGNPIDITWVDESLSDDIDLATPSGKKVGMLAKPASGNYLLTINKQVTDSGEAKIYLYDQIASPAVQAVTLDKPVTNVRINYFKDSSTSDVITEVDLTAPPTPTIVSPNNGAYVRPAGLILDWSDVSDPSAPVVYNYKSYWNGGTYGPVSTGTTSQIDASGTADGEYMWQVQACDNANNCSDWTVATKVIVDGTSPSAPTILSPKEADFLNISPILNSWSIATDNSPIDHYRVEYKYSDGHTFPDYPYRITTGLSRQHSPSLAEQGGVSYRVQAFDKAGNEGAWSDWRYYVYDATIPTIPGTPETQSTTNSMVQKWIWTASTDLGGAGLLGYFNRTYSASTDTVSDWSWLGNILSVTTSLGEGSWKLDIKSVDNAGNESAIARSEEVTVDTTSPSVPTNLHFINPNVSCGGFTNSKTVTFDWDDATDNNKIAGYEYNVDYPLGNSRGSWTTFFTTSTYRGSLNEGIHYLKVRSKDTAGNYSAWSNSCAITYDSILPKLSNKTTFNGWHNQSQTSEFSFEDVNLDAEYTKLSCEISTEGISQTCKVTPNVCDKAGNCYKTSLTSNPADIDYSKPGALLNAWGSTINGTATDSISGIDRVEIRIRKPDDNEITVTATGTNNWTYTMNESPLGTYKAVVIAYDKAGNSSDEVSKEFVMSPPSQDQTQSSSAPAVLGVTTTSNPSKKLASKALQTSPAPDENIVPVTMLAETTSVGGSVLGETTSKPSNPRIYLWIFVVCLLGLLGLIRFIFRVKK